MEFANCAHRGAMTVAPENTLEAFRLAVEQGANEVELDLRLSKDGFLVVMHDATVERTTGARGAVADLTYAELRDLDAGEGQRIPSLVEVLDRIDVRLQVEIKDPAVIAPLADLIARRPGEVERISPCSFDEASVSAVAERLPGAIAGLISKAGAPETVRRAESLGARRVLFGWPGTDRALVEQAQQRGLHVNVWPVNTPAQLADAAALGVDGFTTDYPPLLGENGYTVSGGRLVAGER